MSCVATSAMSSTRRAFAREYVYSLLTARWEKIYDPVRNEHYYYDVTDDRASRAPRAGYRTSRGAFEMQAWNGRVRARPLGEIRTARTDRRSGSPPRAGWKRPAPLMWRDLEHVAPTFTDEQAAMLMQCAWRRLKLMRAVRRTVAKVFSKVYEESTGTHYYYNSQTGATSWTKPLLLGSQDIEVGTQRLVGGDGRVLADDANQPGLLDSDASDASDDDDGAPRKPKRDDDDSDASVMPREWPRSQAQKIVDAAEDAPGRRGRAATRGGDAAVETYSADTSRGGAAATT